MLLPVTPCIQCNPSVQFNSNGNLCEGMMHLVVRVFSFFLEPAKIVATFWGNIKINRCISMKKKHWRTILPQLDNFSLTYNRIGTCRQQ